MRKYFNDTLDDLELSGKPYYKMSATALAQKVYWSFCVCTNIILAQASADLVRTGNPAQRSFGIAGIACGCVPVAKIRQLLASGLARHSRIRSIIISALKTGRDRIGLIQDSPVS